MLIGSHLLITNSPPSICYKNSSLPLLLYHFNFISLCVTYLGKYEVLSNSGFGMCDVPGKLSDKTVSRNGDDFIFIFFFTFLVQCMMMVNAQRPLARARAARQAGQGTRTRPFARMIERMRARRASTGTDTGTIRPEHFPEILEQYPEVNLANYPEYY